MSGPIEWLEQSVLPRTATILVEDGRQRATAVRSIDGRVASTLRSAQPQELSWALTQVVQLKALVDGKSSTLVEPTAQWLTQHIRTLDRGVDQAVQRAWDNREDARASTVKGRVIEYLRQHGSARVLEMAEALERAPSQISRALAQLEDEGVVCKDPTGTAADGRAKFWRLAETVGTTERHAEVVEATFTQGGFRVWVAERQGVTAKSELMRLEDPKGVLYKLAQTDFKRAGKRPAGEHPDADER